MQKIIESDCQSMQKKYYSDIYLFIILLLLPVTSLYPQSAQKIVGNNWNQLITDAIVKPDTAKIKLLLKITDTAMLNYFAGREQNNLDRALQLMNAIAVASNKINYTNGYKRYQLLKSRLLYIQEQDSAAAELHKQAISFYKQANIADLSEAFYFLSESWKYRRHYQQIIIADSIYYFKALAYYKSINDHLKTSSLQRAIAIIHTTNGQLFTAIQEFRDLYKFQLYINDSSRHKTADMLAHCYAIAGNFKEAFFYFQESLKYATEIKDSIALCLYYYRAGRINYNIHEIQKGTNYLMQSLRLAEIQKDTFLCIHISFIMCREGLIEAGKYKEGLDKTLEIIKKYPIATKSNNSESVNILSGLANCYFHLQQYNLSEKYYMQALKIVENEQGKGLPLHKIPVYLDLGRLYLQQRKMQEGSEYLNKALLLSVQIKSLPNIRNTQLELFRLDSTNGNYLSAIAHYQSYKAITDSMLSEAKNKQIEELEIQYQTQQKEKELQLLSNQSKLQQTALEQGKSLRNAMIAGASLLLLLLFIAFNRYRIKQIANKALQEKQDKINQQNQSLEKLVLEEKKLLLEKDKLLDEKEWLMKEIHHRVKNNLQIVMSLLNSQSAYLKDNAALAAIKESQHRVHAISLIHQKLYQSDNLTAVDMEPYIKDVVEYLSDNLDSEHRIKFQVSITPLQLDVAQAVPMGLIINEAITNAVKYAFPNERIGLVNINVYHQLPDEIILTIADDGIGFAPSFNLEHAESLGMSLMKGLCKQLDGEFDIINNNGITIQVKFIPGKSIVEKA